MKNVTRKEERGHTCRAHQWQRRIAESLGRPRQTCKIEKQAKENKAGEEGMRHAEGGDRDSAVKQGARRRQTRIATASANCETCKKNKAGEEGMRHKKLSSEGVSTDAASAGDGDVRNGASHGDCGKTQRDATARGKRKTCEREEGRGGGQRHKKSSDRRQASGVSTDTASVGIVMCATAREGVIGKRGFHAFWHTYRSRYSKMTELYPGEEDFVLPASPRPNPMPKPQPYVVEGFEDVVNAPVLHQPTSDMMPSGDWLKERVLKRLQNAKALRQKAPMSRMNRWARKLANLRRRSMEWLMGGARRVVGVFLGGKRKRAPEACEPSDSDRPVKRIRLEEAPVHVEEPMEVQEAGPAFIEDPDLDDYADIGYGVEENEAANHVILGADDDFNGQNIEPEPIQLADVDVPMDVAPVIPAPDPVVADHQALPEDGANDPQPIQPAARRPRGPRRNPFAVIQAAQGEGFEVSLLANGSVKLVGVIPGFAEQSAFARKAANGGIIIAAPFYSRFTDVSASATHVILRTSRGRIMVFGSNDHGQLGSKRRLRQTRLASQTLGSLMRSPLGMATLKVKSIEALGSESWAWDFEGRAYRCGTANQGRIQGG